MANDINKVIVVGRLTRDAELKYTNSGLAISSFSIAVGEKYKETEHTSFFDCSLFGKMGEALTQYLTKGKQVAITGKLKQERWDDQGQKRSKVKIKVDDLQLLGGKSDSQSAINPTQFEDDIPF